MGMRGPNGMTAFVPNGDNRRDTAILLIGLARDNNLDDAQHVKASNKGFYVSDELADLISQPEPEPDPEPEPEPDPEPEAPKTTAKKSSSKKKASGNRAAKNSTANEE